MNPANKQRATSNKNDNASAQIEDTSEKVDAPGKRLIIYQQESEGVVHLAAKLVMAAGVLVIFEGLLIG